MSEGSGSGSGAEELIELEPNNDAAQATRLLVGKRTAGRLDAATADIDYFFIQSSEGPATLAVTVSAATVAEISTAPGALGSTVILVLLETENGRDLTLGASVLRDLVR